jgi:N-acetylglucosaminyl-diphospho-decaprenol L-rhamnosyltransferase
LLQLSIIIVNYNVQYFLEQCLYSVTKACASVDAEIFVVDNNSTDDSKAFFAGKFSAVKFIWNTENVGFAKANNQALHLCSGKYILFLNPDTILPEDCLTKCIAHLEADNTIGALGVKMIDGSGVFLKESKRGFPSPLTALYKLCGLATIFPDSATFAKYYLGNLSQNDNHEVDVLSGAFIMVPKKIIDVIGSFDETFFMYGEDIDLSYRIQKAGFKNRYFAESTIIHFKGESTNKMSLQYLRHFHKAMYLFVRKHYDFTQFAILYFLIQLLLWPRAILTSFITVFSSASDNNWEGKYAFEKKNRLVVANEHAYNKAVELLKQAGVRLNITARVDPMLSDKSTALGSLNNLPKLVKKYPISEIFFCEETLSFKEIITTAETYSSLKIDYMFHATGSSSIVSSNSRNTKGIFIAVNKIAAPKGAAVYY